MHTGQRFTPCHPKSAKSAFRAPRTSKNVRHVYKSATLVILARKSAPERSKRNFPILTPQNSKIPHTRMPKRESGFLYIFYFLKKLKILHFFPKHSAKGNYRLRCTPFRPKHSKSLKWRRWRSFRSKITQVLQPLCFPRSNGWFLDPKTRLGAQNAF